MESVSSVQETECQELNPNIDSGRGAQELKRILSLHPLKDAVEISVLLETRTTKLEVRIRPPNEASTTHFLNVVCKAVNHHELKELRREIDNPSTKSLLSIQKLKELPDDPFRHILSFLPLEWCPCWCKLEFQMSPSNEASTAHLLNIVDEAFGLHNLSVPYLEIHNPVDGISLQKLFSLPSLEVLILRCGFDGSKAIKVTAPKLRKLVLILGCHHGSEAISITAPNLRELSIYDRPVFECKTREGFEVFIDGSNLESFEYSGHLLYDLRISAPSLDRATVITKAWHIYGSVERLHKLLKGLSNARVLALSSAPVVELDQSSEITGSLPALSDPKVLQRLSHFH